MADLKETGHETELETEPKVKFDAAMDERNGSEDKKVATSSD